MNSQKKTLCDTSKVYLDSNSNSSDSEFEPSQKGNKQAYLSIKSILEKRSEHSYIQLKSNLSKSILLESKQKHHFQTTISDSSNQAHSNQLNNHKQFQLELDIQEQCLSQTNIQSDVNKNHFKII